MTLWEGARRLPYFFVWVEAGAIPRSWVFCPQCALEHRGEEELRPRYITASSVMCCRCGILLGPINATEMGNG